MVASNITEDVAMAVLVELLWKAAFSHDASTMQKAFAGMVDAVEIKGDGVGWDEVVVEGGEAAALLKSQVVQVKVVPAGEGACVAKVTVEYELLGGAVLSPEDKAKLVKGYVGLIKKAEENLAARPGEFSPELITSSVRHM
ncbi:uncharacterized protein [Setaria viridis]|uniref:uncharacterized protein n=1 Tax=Setaria viridis TaxID=4556 RepID=UPI0014935FF6|nr:uncharacterized protein LOC117849307 [Setaria viridis]